MGLSWFINGGKWDCCFLIRPIVFKELHVNALQRYAHAAYQDGLDIPTIRDLASLACWGRHPGNVERDLHRMIPSLFGSQFPLHSVCIDAYDPDTASIHPVEIPILLASDVLNQIWEKNSPQLWKILIGSTAEKTNAFWSAFATNGGSCANHPVIQHFSGINLFLVSLPPLNLWARATWYIMGIPHGLYEFVCSLLMAMDQQNKFFMHTNYQQIEICMHAMCYFYLQNHIYIYSLIYLNSYIYLYMYIYI